MTAPPLRRAPVAPMIVWSAVICGALARVAPEEQLVERMASPPAGGYGVS